ncbi:MAG: TRAP transporter large permease subunit [Thiolinea sp.]
MGGILSGLVHPHRRGSSRCRRYRCHCPALRQPELAGVQGQHHQHRNEHRDDLSSLGAGFYNGFLALTQVPQELSSFVVSQGFSPWMVLVLILVFYLIFGCLMDSLSMILLTIPIFFPVISALDFGMSPEHLAIWFGVLVLIVAEVGLITPPVGMNLFIINSMDRETPMLQTYKSVLYFVASDLIRVAILVLFPAITLFLLGD